MLFEHFRIKYVSIFIIKPITNKDTETIHHIFQYYHCVCVHDCLEEVIYVNI